MSITKNRFLQVENQQNGLNLEQANNTEGLMQQENMQLQNNLNPNAQLQNGVVGQSQQNSEVRIEQGVNEEVVESIHVAQQAEMQHEETIIRQEMPVEAGHVANQSYNLISNLYTRLLAVDDGVDGKGKFTPMKNAMFSLLLSWKSLGAKEKQIERKNAIKKVKNAADVYLNTHRWVFFSRGKSRKAVAKAISESMNTKILNVKEQSEYDKNESRLKTKELKMQAKMKRDDLVDRIQVRDLKLNNNIKVYQNVKDKMIDTKYRVQNEDDLKNDVGIWGNLVLEEVESLKTILFTRVGGVVNRVNRFVHDYDADEMKGQPINIMLEEEKERQNQEEKEQQKEENEDTYQEYKIEIDNFTQKDYEKQAGIYQENIKKIENELTNEQNIKAEYESEFVVYGEQKEELEKLKSEQLDKNDNKDNESKENIGNNENNENNGDANSKLTEKIKDIEKLMSEIESKMNKSLERINILETIMQRQNEKYLRMRDVYTAILNEKESYKLSKRINDSLKKMQEGHQGYTKIYGKKDNQDVNKSDELMRNIVTKVEKDINDNFAEYSPNIQDRKNRIGKSLQDWNKLFDTYNTEIINYEKEVGKFISEDNDGNYKNISTAQFMNLKRKYKNYLSQCQSIFSIGNSITTEFKKMNARDKTALDENVIKEIDKLKEEVDELNNKINSENKVKERLNTTNQRVLDMKEIVFRYMVESPVMEFFVNNSTEAKDKELNSGKGDNKQLKEKLINVDENFLESIGDWCDDFLDMEFDFEDFMGGNDIVNNLKNSIQKFSSMRKEYLQNQKNIEINLEYIMKNSPLSDVDLKIDAKKESKEEKEENLKYIVKNSLTGEKLKTDEEIKKKMEAIRQSQESTKEIASLYTADRLQLLVEKHIQSEKKKKLAYAGISREFDPSEELVKMKENIIASFDNEDFRAVIDLTRKVDKQTRIIETGNPLSNIEKRINDCISIEDLKNEINQLETMISNEALSKNFIEVVSISRIKEYDTKKISTLDDLFKELDRVDAEYSKEMNVYISERLSKVGSLKKMLLSQKNMLEIAQEKVKVVSEINNERVAEKQKKEVNNAENQENVNDTNQLIEAIETENAQILRFNYVDTDFSEMEVEDISTWIKGFLLYNQLDLGAAERIGDSVDELIDVFRDINTKIEINKVNVAENYKLINAKYDFICQNMNSIRTEMMKKTSPLYKHRNTLGGMLKRIESRNFLNEIRNKYVVSQDNRVINNKEANTNFVNATNAVYNKLLENTAYRLADDGDSEARLYILRIMEGEAERIIKDEQMSFISRYVLINNRIKYSFEDTVEDADNIALRQLEYEFSRGKVEEITADVLRAIGLHNMNNIKNMNKDVRDKINNQYKDMAYSIVKRRYVNPIEEGKFKRVNTFSSAYTDKLYKQDSLIVLAEAYQNNPKKLIKMLVEKNIYQEFFGALLDKINLVTNDDALEEDEKVTQVEELKKTICTNYNSLIFYISSKNQKGIKDELVEKGGLILKRIIDNEEGYEEKMFNANKNWWHFWKKYKKTSKYYARKN